MSISPAQMPLCLDAAEAGSPIRHPSQQQSTSASKLSEPIKAERKLLLRKGVQRLANRLARMLGVELREVHRAWIAFSGLTHGKATEEYLLRKKKWLTERIREA